LGLGSKVWTQVGFWRRLVANAIRQSIHKQYQVFINQETPWGLLRNLRQRLSPECDPTYKASLRAAWRNLDRGLDKDTDIDKWLLNWQTLQTRCAKAGITEASEASIQFLEAISVISPEFYAAWIVLVETSSASTKSQEEKQAEFGSLLNRYKAHWLITHGRPAQQRGISIAVFSAWQGHQEAQPGSTSASKSARKKSSDLPIEKRSCPCSRMKHAPWRCWAAYPEDKPDDKPAPHPDRKKAWDKAMKEDPDWKAFVSKKRSEESASKNTHANTVLRRGELGFFLAESPKANNVFPVQKSIPIDHEHSMIDHDHSAINHEHSMFHQTSYDPLRDRWLIDTGAQVHICNNRSLFIEFQETASSIRVGDTETMVNGIGTVLIHGISPREETPKQIMLFEVKYSPGFHTNVISHGLIFPNARAFLNFEKMIVL
jgi:hypothetical protein